eukprot:TRINITY_DN495_c0_g1_i1.p1 TRINITY_DN495_c0_g1~~TRINITY_DN495_c0_g1_i1.p1  ORF type:complete len:269 (+),score=27.46 TRINITY_DN495_c0_g1_i1:37-843(+)
MISASNLAALLAILEDTEQSLDQTTKTFCKAVPKADRFKTACTMCMMIKEELLPCEPKLSALFLLYDLYKGEPFTTNPFLPVFLTILQDTEQVACSCFVSYLFDAQAPLELRKHSVKKILSSIKVTTSHPTIAGLPQIKRLSSDDIALLEKQQVEIPSGMEYKAGIGISPRLYFEVDNNNDEEEDYNRLDDLTAEELTFDTFAPHLMSPSPPLFPTHQSELEWIHPNIYNHMVTWDCGMLLDTEQDSEVSTYLARAFKGPLLPQQTKL